MNLLKKILPEGFILSFWHYPKALLAAFIYGFPAKKLIIIGVAGTKGKTTTCYLTSQILDRAGKKVAMFSTAVLKINQKEELNKIKMTTPSPFLLQKFIRKAVDAGCEYLILETSSHALIQGRLFGAPFDVVLLTNMMPDHLDYHKTKEKYVRSHLKMLGPRLKYLILNSDDSNLAEFLKIPPESNQRIIYGIHSKKDVFAENIVLHAQGSSFVVKSNGLSQTYNLPLLGKFNIYNALAAISLGISQGISPGVIKAAIQSAKPTPGRLERINSPRGFEIIVDYAHSPDSLRNLFETVSFLKQGHIITVFGACGERDAAQRPLMGKIIDKNSDLIIITNDDPYGEDPKKIAKEVLIGIKNKTLNQNLWQILDRKSAIKKALSLAKKNDLVLILGKGSEQWQVFKDKKVPWDDRQVVREIIGS